MENKEKFKHSIEYIDKLNEEMTNLKKWAFEQADIEYLAPNEACVDAILKANVDYDIIRRRLDHAYMRLGMKFYKQIKRESEDKDNETKRNI